MNNAPTSARALPVLLAAAAVLMLALLLAHPHEQAHTFAELIEFEIDHRLIDAVVHGGMIAVLVLLLAAHRGVGRLVDPGSVCVAVAVTAFATGCGLLIASLVLDGFTVPALAQQSHAAREVSVQHAIQVQIGFCGTLIGILMPLAILAFSASAVAWVGALVRLGGAARLVGWIAGAAGMITAVLIIAAMPGASPHVLMGSFLLVALWQFALALVARQLARAVTAA